jgi:hypothetical protein
MKKNIFKKSLLFAFGAIMLASCGDGDNSSIDYNPPASHVPTILQAEWFTMPNGYYHGKEFPVPTMTTPVTTVTLSSPIVVNGVAYANVTVVSASKFRRFFLGVEGVEEYWEVMPAGVDEVGTGTQAAMIWDEETGLWTYIIPIQYVSTTNTDFNILLSAEDADCNITSLTEVAPTPPSPGTDPTPPAPTPGDDPEPVTPKPDEPAFPGVEGAPEDLHVYMIFDQQNDLDLYLATPGGTEIYWQNLRGGSTLNPRFKMDLDAYHYSNPTDPTIEHIFIPKKWVMPGVYTIRVNLHKWEFAPNTLTNWKIWATYDKKFIKDDLTGTTFTATDPHTGYFAADATTHPVGKLLTAANKALAIETLEMQFTITDAEAGYHGTLW